MANRTALVRFRDEYCPNVPLDSDVLLNVLIGEVSKLLKNKN